MIVGEAMKLESALYCDEVQETVLCEGVPAVALDVGEIDPPPQLSSDVTN